MSMLLHVLSFLALSLLVHAGAAVASTRLIEIDGYAQVEFKVLEGVPLPVLQQAPQYGWRLTRFQREKFTTESYNAILVKNLGAFQDPLAVQLNELSGQQLNEYNTQAQLRAAQIPIGISCRQERGGVRYQVLAKKNTLASGQFLTYTVYPSLSESELLALGSLDAPTANQVRIIDFDVFNQVGQARFCAIGIHKGQTEWAPSDVIKVSKLELHNILPADAQTGAQRARVMAVRSLTAGTYYILRDDPSFAGHNSQLNLSMKSSEPASQPEHMAKRLGARPVSISSYHFPLAKLHAMTYQGLNGLASNNAAISLKQQFAPLSSQIGAILRAAEIPGASVAIVKQGRLIYAAGFGLANIETNAAVTPQYAFRLASVSKPITAMAVHHATLNPNLANFALSTKPFEDSQASQPGNGLNADQITIEHLLRHRSAFKCAFSWTSQASDIVNSCAAQDESCCPGFVSCRNSATCACNNGCSVQIPGKSSSNYSQYMNSNFMLLGDYFERTLPAPKAPYLSALHQYTSENLFAPLKIKRIFPGGAAPPQTVQVKNYVPGGYHSPSGFDSATWAEDSMARLGSTRWAGSSVDILRLFCAFDRSCGAPHPVPFQAWMRVGVKPNASDLVGQTSFMGMGFSITHDPADARRIIKYEHGGLLPGSTLTRVSKFEQQNIWIAVLLNSDVAPYRTGYAHPVELIEQAALQAAMTVPTGQVNDFDKLGL